MINEKEKQKLIIEGILDGIFILSVAGLFLYAMDTTASLLSLCWVGFLLVFFLLAIESYKENKTKQREKIAAELRQELTK